jgi:hypothetical protein
MCADISDHPKIREAVVEVMDDVLDAFLLFLMLRRRLCLPRELSRLIRSYGSARHRVPASHLQFMEGEHLRDMARECRESVMRATLADARGGGALILVAASVLEGVGEVLAPLDPMFYLLCLCISRRALVREAHFDVAWAVAYAFETTPRERYPVPLLDLWRV